MAPQNTSDLCDNSASRLNVAKSAIQAILQTYVGNTDFGLLTYATGAPSLYTTWLYVMSNPGGFTFSSSITPSPPAASTSPTPATTFPPVILSIQIASTWCRCWEHNC